jgi:hypothetical protein
MGMGSERGKDSPLESAMGSVTATLRAKVSEKPKESGTAWRKG